MHLNIKVPTRLAWWGRACWAPPWSWACRHRPWCLSPWKKKSYRMRILTVGQPRTSPPSHIHSHTHSHTPTHTDSHTHTQTAGPANTFRQREELPKMLLMGCCQTAVEKKKKKLPFEKRDLSLPKMLKPHHGQCHRNQYTVCTYGVDLWILIDKRWTISIFRE